MRTLFFLGIAVLFLGSAGLSAFVIFTRAPEPVSQYQQEVSPSPEETAEVAPVAPQEDIPAVPNQANLAMAYINESPDGSWTGSWKNACEEAAITMVEKYYQGVATVSTEEAMTFMQTLFAAQQAAYGSDRDSDAERTLALIAQHTSFNGTIVEDPTLEAIKSELDAGRPVIAFHRGFDLQNKNIPFLPTGSSYHATVVKGYDDARDVFLVHDTGDVVDGADHAYAYDRFMQSLHDFDYVTRRADGPPRVIFTSPR